MGETTPEFTKKRKELNGNIIQVRSPEENISKRKAINVTLDIFKKHKDDIEQKLKEGENDE